MRRFFARAIGVPPAGTTALPVIPHTRGVYLMTICERCNTENLDGSQYCDECGAPLDRGAASAKGSGTGELGGGTGGRQFAEAAAGQAKSAEAHVVAPVFSGPSSTAVSVVEDAHAKLVIERGRSAGKQFPLTEEESQIGRWDADGGIFPEIDLDADDPEAKVSRRHARIMRRNGEYFVEDLGSTNGTFINRGRRLLPGDRQPLRDGDEIIVGKTFLRFHITK
ncbi:MAG TPA: FHA domain-containing protein [Pyrinomonadaceae bacterium]